MKLIKLKLESHITHKKRYISGSPARVVRTTAVVAARAADSLTTDFERTTITSNLNSLDIAVTETEFGKDLITVSNELLRLQEIEDPLSSNLASFKASSDNCIINEYNENLESLSDRNDYIRNLSDFTIGSSENQEVAKGILRMVRDDYRDVFSLITEAIASMSFDFKQIGNVFTHFFNGFGNLSYGGIRNVIANELLTSSPQRAIEFSNTIDRIQQLHDEAHAKLLIAKDKHDEAIAAIALDSDRYFFC